MKYLQSLTIYLFVCCLFIFIANQAVFAHDIEDITAIEVQIQSYIADNDLDISMGSPEYETFVRDAAYWNLYPELTDNMGEQAYNYANQYLQTEGESDSDTDPSLDIFDVSTLVYDIYLPLVMSEGNSDINYVNAAAVPGYNGQDAANYALANSTDGERSRTQGHPDFTNDCTGFVSQALEAGGFSQNGSGSCVTEWNVDEWYVTGSSWLCKRQGWRDNNQFAWSSSWSVVGQFTRHQISHKVDEYNGKKGAWLVGRDNLKFLRDWGDVGEVIQLLRIPNSGNWDWDDIYHTMIITDKRDGEIYLTYHTGPNGNDVVDISLDTLSSRLTDDRRFILLEYFW